MIGTGRERGKLHRSLYFIPRAMWEPSRRDVNTGACFRKTTLAAVCIK